MGNFLIKIKRERKIKKGTGMGIKKRSNKNILYFFIIILLILGLNLFGQNYLKNLFYFISAPMQDIFWDAGQITAGWIESHSNLRTLQKDKEDLWRQNQILIGENIRLQKLREEIKYLRQAMEIRMEQDFELTLVRVIAKNAAQDKLLINKGERDGISMNMPLITSEKVLLGRVNKVYQNFSKVMLISNNEKTFDIWVYKQDNEKIKGIIRGRGHGQVFLDLIPADQELKIGDIVSTSLLGGIFPEGLFIGKIESIVKDDIAVFQEVEVNLAFDINKLDHLFIIKNFR